MTSSEVRIFLDSCNIYITGKEYSNGDGTERRLAILREMADPYIQEMIQYRQFKDKNLEEDTLLVGQRHFTRKEEDFDEEWFITYMS